jgi:hypothetical protein
MDAEKIVNMKKSRATWITVFLLVTAITRCNFTSEPITPTMDGITEEAINPLPARTETLPSPTITPSPSLTVTQPDQIALAATAALAFTALPSNTPLPSPTLGPWVYTIQVDDTLLFIIQQPPFNYSVADRAVIEEIVRINDTIFSADILPPPGTEILIPRPTEAPLPPNIPTADPGQVLEVSPVNPNVTIDAEGVIIVPPDRPNITPPPMRPNKGLPTGSYVGCHIVRPNETVAGILEQYAGLTLDVFNRLNADLNYSGCDFNIPSGGPLCNPTIRESACVNVVLPTPTPTLSPTPSGSETPTPTPTYMSPRVISPLDGSTVSAGVLTLSWVTVGELGRNEVYLIQLTDTTTGEMSNFTTTATTFRLPASVIPTDGQTHIFNWVVSVAVRDSSGFYVPVGSGAHQTHSFSWQSR